MESKRQQQFARLIQKEVSDIFQRDGLSYFGSGSLVTITLVRTSPDLSLAKIYLSVFGVKDRDALLERIKTHSSEIRNQLGRRIKNQVRHIPELAFFIDDSLDYVDKMEKLFRNINHPGEN